MTKSSRSALGLVAAALLLTVIGAVEVFGEVSPYFNAGISPERRFQATASNAYHPGRSFGSKELLLRDCMEVAESIYAKAQPTERRRSFLDACSAEATAAVAEMPGYARAWLVKAYVSAELGQSEEFGQALAAAQRTAPNAHWLAEQRTKLAELKPGLLAADAGYNYEQDLRALLDSYRGIEALAARYVADPKLRPVLTQIVETASSETQARFLAEVRKHGAAQSGG